MCSLIFSSKYADRQNIPYITEYLSKRGPDLTNSVTHEGFSYVHCLLSITGITTPQPIFSADKNIVLMFVGEIYNYKDFGNYNCDTECLIPLYEKQGINFIQMLSGEFSIVIVDHNTNEIIITTDTFSTRPLFISNKDGLGVSTYKSGISRIGFEEITKIPANTTLIYDLTTLSLKHKQRVTIFDLNQYKTDFSDWNKAFSHAISQRCANTRESLCMGLSSGFDSGIIALELIKQNIPFKAYSVTGSENMNILRKRWDILKDKCELEIITITPEMKQKAHDWLIKNTEDWKYTIYSKKNNYNEFGMSLWDDNGSNNLSYVCSLAKRDNKKIFISGGGADEMYDYGGKYKHSSFSGIFPNDLSTIFPWPSVFGSSQESYLQKDNYVGGSYGLEPRFPFVNKEIWQEFLWLSVELKNKCYKSAIRNYLEESNFPFQPNQKIGF